MQRLESAAWPLAGGVLCAFVLAVVLKDAAWQVAFAAVAASVAGWALPASPEVGAVLGLTAWTFVTGFDVGKTGDLSFTGTDDVVRAAVLVVLGVVAGAAGSLLTGPERPPADDSPPAPEGHGHAAHRMPDPMGDPERRPATPPHPVPPRRIRRRGGDGPARLPGHLDRGNQL